MTKEELRVGNHVNTDSKSELRTVVEIRHSVVSVKYIRSDTNQPHQSMVEYDRLTPIPLTEEWLLKFGFRKMLIDNIYVFKYGKLELNRTGGEGFYTSTYKGNFLRFIINAHQLQNLYYTLTGEELTIKE